MSGRKSPLPFVAVAAAGLFGAWLLGMFETEPAPDDASGGSVLTALAGFIILLGSIVAFTFLLRNALPPITRPEMVAWGPVWERGKSRFVRANVVRGLKVGLLSLASIILYEYLRNEPGDRVYGVQQVILYLALLLIVVGGVWYNASRVWAVNEEAYNRLVGGASPADETARGRPYAARE